ncbi:MAG: orotidine-5'-phosphate decarboxylase [Nitrospirae bacterium]|nr:orotidine-5'-phosphate decarboxylase [Nitrospirota bacterium]
MRVQPSPPAENFPQDSSLSAKDRLIFALDYPTLQEAEKAVSMLGDHVGLFKVGLELFVAAGPSIFKAIARNSACGTFLDMKFHDIPETVRAAVKASAAYNIRFVTVHASEGKGLLKAVVDTVQKGTKVLAVTVLTSLRQLELRDIGIDKNLDLLDLVILRTRLAMDSGCAGVVCSGVEVRSIKERVGQGLIAVVPGIRPAWASVPNDDQKRITTPRQAIVDGADYIVVGRPIRSARDPVQAADRIVEEIKTALHDRSVHS